MGLTRLSLYTPPTTHHTNSTSTRNIDPRGLKFCRRPYQAKLTTIQHNFNPTIFWGGGSYILHLGLTLPFVLNKKISDPNLFDQHFFYPKIFLPKIFFYPKYLWPKLFLTKIVIDSKKCLPRISLTQIFFDQIFFWPNNFLTQKFF